MSQTIGNRARATIWIIGSMCVFPITARADEATKQLFLREYPAASRVTAQRFEHFKCNMLIKPSNGQKGSTKCRYTKSEKSVKADVHSKYDLQHRIDENYHIIMIYDDWATRLTWNWLTETYVDDFESFTERRPQYIVDFYRKSKGLMHTWSLVSANLSNAAWKRNIERSIESQFGQYVHAMWGLGPEFLAGCMRQPGFELIDAEPVADRPGIVEVRFRRDTAQGRESAVRLDTNNHWAVVSYRSPIQATKNDYAFEVEYGEPVEGIAWPSRVSIANGMTISIDDWSFEPTPIEEFRPSFYGCRDRVFDWTDPRHLFVAAAGVLMAISLMIFAILRFRKAIKSKRSEMQMAGKETPGEMQ